MLFLLGTPRYNTKPIAACQQTESPIEFEREKLEEIDEQVTPTQLRREREENNPTELSEEYIDNKVDALHQPELESLPSVDSLSARETEILQLLIKGHLNKEIAATLNISEKTVEYHLDKLYRRLNVSTRTEATCWAMQNGITPAD